MAMAVLSDPANLSEIVGQVARYLPLDLSIVTYMAMEA